MQFLILFGKNDVGIQKSEYLQDGVEGKLYSSSCAATVQIRFRGSSAFKSSSKWS